MKTQEIVSAAPSTKVFHAFEIRRMLAMGVFSSLLALGVKADAVFQTLHSFGGAASLAPLIQTSDGSFYGTTVAGGASNFGGIFRVAGNGVYTSLYSFTGGLDGAAPYGGLLQGSDGSLYGTAAYGGSNGDGTIFKIAPSGTLTPLYSFTGMTDGANPMAGLIQDGDGNLYGTAAYGGAAGFGTVFRFASNGLITTLYAFTNGIDGENPRVPLTLGSDGNFYGTAYGGYGAAVETVFRVTPSGAFSRLSSYIDAGIGSALAPGSGGNMYGSLGITFVDVSTNGSVQWVAYNFYESQSFALGPVQLAPASDGYLYGTSCYAGASNAGTIFYMVPMRDPARIYSFNGAGDGAFPEAPLIQASDGNLYGTTSAGGIGNNGVVFRISTNGVFTTVCQLTGGDANANSYSGLVQGSDGNFYGTSFFGGASTNGTVFRITPDGTTTTLYSFTGGADGAAPYASLTTAADGNFYGTTSSGGASNNGSVFRIANDGTITPLYSFTGGADGSRPYAGLAQANDGNLYGTAYAGGTGRDGTVFRITTNGVLTTLYSFNGTNGAAPKAALLQAADGNLYGTTLIGGSNDFGTIFQITTNGGFTQLHSFAGAGDGQYPSAALIQACDGNLYGTTPYGGAGGNGAIYRITTNGAFSQFYAFGGQTAGHPQGPLAQAGDSNFYGTSFDGGASGNGMIFQLTRGGALTTIYSFNGTNDGANSFSGLLAASDGNLYGTTFTGGGAGNGTVFRIVLPVTFSSPYLSGGNLDLGFQAVAGQSYTVQQNTNLATTNWVYYTNFTGAGSGVQLTIPLTNAAAQFFRLREP